ncbi:MAG: sensor histidine kinase [Rhodopila sp.]
MAQACGLIRDRYAFSVAGWPGPVPKLPDERLQADLTEAVSLALARQEGVEGGIWQAEAGPLAYAFPTYEGTGPKTDLPAAERNEIQTVNQQVASDGRPADREVISRTQTLLLHACPLPAAPIGGLTGWTMTRVQSAPGLLSLQLRLGMLLALMVLMSVWLGRMLLAWGRHVHGIEEALADAGPDGLPTMPRTGERELDRIIDALNDAGRRLDRARRESEDMATRVTRAERLAGLGRVAAGVAHEIRNPLAAARLQGENALAGDDARRRQAITAMLGQIQRLDTLVSELLAMTQRVEPSPRPTDLASFLADVAARHGATAAAKRQTITIPDIAGTAVLDPAVIGRVLDNLLTNAIRHGPEGGTIAMTVERHPGLVTLLVADSGPGIAPEMRDRLFEPFVTGRADGTGLGLAIARELADAHHGRRLLRPRAKGQGAVFAVELPEEAAWRRS